MAGRRRLATYALAMHYLSNQACLACDNCRKSRMSVTPIAGQDDSVVLRPVANARIHLEVAGI